MLSRKRASSFAGMLAVSALLATACNGSSGSGSQAAAPEVRASGPVTLNVGLFGTFGFKEAGLYDEYKKLHPNITIVEQSVEQSADYYKALQTHLAANSGLADVQGIEIGFVADVVKNHGDQFADFSKRPDADKIKGTFYDWKYGEATTSSGKVVGLGTDAGPQAMCFRKDLFQKAGLPTDRAELGKAWVTWDGFTELGKKYEASPTKQKGSRFLDSAASIFSSAVYQGDQAYDDKDGNPIPDKSDGVSSAWRYASTAATSGITAGLSQFGQQWNSAFANGAFATIACPSWMLGYISSQAGTAASGKWDVAPLPGQASNWGGSWIGVPEASAHKAEAMDLVEWLTAPEQQVKMFTKEQHFPSSKTAAEDPAVKTATSTYFSGAPIGEVFGASASALKLTPIGPYDTQVQQAFTTALTNVEKGTAPDKAFATALTSVKDITGG